MQLKLLKLNNNNFKYNFNLANSTSNALNAKTTRLQIQTNLEENLNYSKSNQPNF